MTNEKFANTLPYYVIAKLYAKENFMNLPNDPVILLSFINTQLRDKYASLEDLSASLDADADEIKNKLAAINYEYDSRLNKFV